jgi:redox-sensitive bicupin YhaK (pirin superfamily)
MIELRPFNRLGGGNHGWLESKFHFSFADYHDDERLNWGRLRVWNDDEIAAGTGFGTHSHANMEIITYVTQGAITHKDSQVMSAGTGIAHSEYNLEKETTKLFQIWIMPNRRGGAPSWGARPFPKDARSGQFVTLASGLPADTDTLQIRSDARVSGATLKAGETTEYKLGAGRYAYLVPARGSIEVNGMHAGTRDGLAIADEDVLRVTALEDAEIVLVDAG